MWLSVLGPILLIQLGLIIVAVFVLKKILEYKLTELAIQKFEHLEIKREKDKGCEVTVESFKKLNTKRKQSIMRAALNNFGQDSKVIFKVEKRLWGGMLIKYGSTVLRYSLKERLKEGGLLKG